MFAHGPLIILEPTPSLTNGVGEDDGFDESMLHKSLPLVKKATKEPKFLALKFKNNFITLQNAQKVYINGKITQCDKCDYCCNGEKIALFIPLTKCEFTLNVFTRLSYFFIHKAFFIYSLDIQHIIFWR